MSIIQKTTNLELTQFTGSLEHSGLYGFYNSDMLKIDTWSYQLQTIVENAASVVAGYNDRVTALEDWQTTVNYTLNDYGSRLIAIEDVIATVSTANIDDLRARMDALEAKVAANTDGIDICKTDISELAQRMSTAEQKLIDDDNAISGLTGRVTALENCCDEVRETLSDHNLRITNNANDIATLTSRVGVDENNIAANAADISILATQTAQNTSDIADLKSDFAELDPQSQLEVVRQVSINKENIEALQTVQQSQASSISNLATRLTGDEATISSNTGRIAQLESDIAQVQDWNSRITAAEETASAADATATQAASDVASLATDVQGIDTRVQDTETAIGDWNTVYPTVPIERAFTAFRNGYNAHVIESTAKITALESTVGDANGGLVKDVADLQGADTGLGNRVSAIETQIGNTTMTTTAQTLTGSIEEVHVAANGLTSRVNTLEGAVGDSTSGLVKDVTDLQTTVGDSSSGLVKKVDDLETTVGDSSSGLVKDVSDIESIVGDSNAGLVKDVADLQNDVGHLANYSTNEVAIGKWIDGKTIYRKVLTGNTLPNDDAVLITNVETLVNYYGSQFYTAGNIWYHFPYCRGTGQVEIRPELYEDVHELRMQRSSVASTTKYKWIFEYTKYSD